MAGIMAEFISWLGLSDYTFSSDLLLAIGCVFILFCLQIFYQILLHLFGGR